MNPLVSIQVGAAAMLVFGLRMLTNTSQPNTWPLRPLVPNRETRCPDGGSNSLRAIWLAVPTVTTVAVARVMRAAVATSATTNGGGGTMRSSIDTADPFGVLIVIRPEPALEGTGAVTVVVVAAVGPVNVALTRAWLFAGTVSKFVPVMVSDVPATADVGEKLVIVGALEIVTVKGPSLVSEPFWLVTETVPVVAPDGTVTASELVEAEVIAAVVPLNDTVF